jgi:AcrR family transcriptional regulator
MAQTAGQRGDAVRQKLLSAATELIGELGWSAVSTRILAERAGVAPGLVHYHFSNLQALLRTAAIGAISALLDSAVRPAQKARTAQQRIAIMLEPLDAHTGSDQLSLLFIETYLAATRDDVLRADLIRILAEFRSLLAGWLNESGHDAPDATAAVIAAAIDGVILHRSLDPGLTSAVVGPILGRILFAPPASPTAMPEGVGACER